MWFVTKFLHPSAAHHKVFCAAAAFSFSDMSNLVLAAAVCDLAVQTFLFYNLFDGLYTKDTFVIKSVMIGMK
jgi:hypothetical protein